MKTYHLMRKQILPIMLKEAWDFFSKPKNLALITPPRLSFEILSISGGPKMHSGQIIHYKISILPGIRMRWVSEITQVKEPFHFIDEQRSGPYSLWHHQHSFEEVTGGVEMTDKLTYAIPLGWIGRFTHWIFVNREVNAIFDYRYKLLETYFRHPKR